MKDSIKLIIPSKAEYISVVRLTASSIANNIGMSIDAIDDIKVCISEACMNAMIDQEEINITFNIYKGKLKIFVNNVLENKILKEDVPKRQGLGMLIIRSLMDEVAFTEEGVEMTKFSEDELI